MNRRFFGKNKTRSYKYPGVDDPFDKQGDGGCLPGNGIWRDLRANI